MPLNARIMTALSREIGGIVLILCDIEKAREWWARDIETMVASQCKAFFPETMNDILSRPDEMALWVPTDEVHAVRELDGNLGRISDRTQPIVLFLLHDGEGALEVDSSLSELWSISAGNQIDPEKIMEIDVSAERLRFIQKFDKTPEEWLRLWHAHGIKQTAEATSTYYLAMLLEE